MRRSECDAIPEDQAEVLMCSNLTRYAALSALAMRMSCDALRLGW